jgi:hypothetical protein
MAQDLHSVPIHLGDVLAGAQVRRGGMSCQSVIDMKSIRSDEVWKQPSARWLGPSTLRLHRDARRLGDDPSKRAGGVDTIARPT